MTLSAIIAANRFGLGARPGELTDIGDDARVWLTRQVAGTRPVPQEVAGLPSSAVAFQTFAKALRERRQDKGDAAKSPENGRRQIGAMYRDQVAARYRLAIRTEEPFRERLVHFWTNHFAVSADKAQVVGLAATLENEAIRPNVGGRFVDLLLAVEMHPAMILYLDNQASIGPNSPLAQKAARRADGDRKLDINENPAREILELHTLGVNGGYAQTDVTTFARALTGWSVAAARGKESAQAGSFGFVRWRMSRG